MKKTFGDWYIQIFLIAAAVTWGLVGLFGFNLVTWGVGIIQWAFLGTLIYIAMLIAGILAIYRWWIKGKSI